MDSNWALGVSRTAPRSIDIITANGQRRVVDLEALTKEGIPSSQKTKRLVFEGEFSSWQPGSADAYLASLGMALPEDCENRHEVYTLVSDKGITVHVPALVLMRAFFRPNHLLFRAVFAPAGIDLLSFVDYSAMPPVVVIDDITCAKHLSKMAFGVSQDRALQWLQLSKSARKTAQSAYRNALKGWLGVSLPLGQVRIAFHGPLTGKQLFATKAALVSVEIPEHDSITGAREEIIFHAMADTERNPAASIREVTVPLHPDGRAEVTQAEWERIEPMLKGKKPGPAQHSQREVLNTVLYKLASGLAWKKSASGNLTITDLTSAFRRWSTSGRLDKVLVYLTVSRKPGTTPTAYL